MEGKTNDGGPGHCTGYYESEMSGSQKRTKNYRYPVFCIPKRGPRRITRRSIDRCVGRSGSTAGLISSSRRFKAPPGSKFEDGTFTRVGDGAQNGHRYRVIGKIFIDEDSILREKRSMQAIRSRPTRAMRTKSSYVFSKNRDCGRDNPGPRGAMSTPLTSLGNIAGDRRYIPLDTPMWIDTTRTRSTTPAT